MLLARIDTNVMGLTPGDVAITDTHTWIYRFALTGNLAAEGPPQYEYWSSIDLWRTCLINGQLGPWVQVGRLEPRPQYPKEPWRLLNTIGQPWGWTDRTIESALLGFHSLLHRSGEPRRPEIKELDNEH